MPGGVSYLGDFLPPPPEPSGLVGAAARVSARDTGLDRVRPCKTVGRGGEAGETCLKSLVVTEILRRQGSIVAPGSSCGQEGVGQGSSSSQQSRVLLPLCLVEVVGGTVRAPWEAGGIYYTSVEFAMHC